ncbi:MAG: hypothetical protein WC975_09385 [Phycisphaerae bacterium]
MKQLKTIISIWFAIQTITVCAYAAPATQPSGPVSGKVLKVVGKVQYSTIGKNDWVYVKEGDTLNAGTVIRAGLRSSALIQLQTAAIIQIKSGSRIALTELARSATSEKTRIHLDYGTVRGGIVETNYSSDFQIACPAAVLSREGTWGFEMSYDPATGHFYVGLDTEGLVRILQLATGRHILLSPGQFVTQAMQRWVETAVFQGTVTFTDPFGTTKVEVVFYANNSGGRTVMDPTGSRNVESNIRMGMGTFGNQWTNRMQLDRRSSEIQTLDTTLEQLEFNLHPVFEYRFGNFGTHIPADSGAVPSFIQKK